MSDLPAPLTPPKSNLRGLPHIPWEFDRWRDSNFVRLRDPEEIVAGMMLIGAAFYETPSASLPDNDRLLAMAAGYGRAIDAWLKVKEGALHGFILCGDGRLYHPTVARLANAAWKGRIEHRYRGELARIRKHNERHPDQPIEAPSFEDFAACFPDNVTPPVRATEGDCPRDIDALSDGHGAPVRATEGDCSANIGTKEKHKVSSKDGESPVGLVRADLDQAFQIWNETAARCGWPQAIKLDDRRRKSLAARLRECGIDGWQATIAKAEASAYLTGGEATWFSFDWVIKPTNFTKLSEGNYDNRDGAAGQSAWGAVRAANTLRGDRPDPALDLYRLGVAGEEMEERAAQELKSQLAMAVRHGFRGKVLDVDAALMAEWLTIFHAIPDMHAELVGIDAWLTGAGANKAREWRAHVPGMLSRKHQEALERRDDSALEIPPGIC